jgi:hypothetical protein
MIAARPEAGHQHLQRRRSSSDAHTMQSRRTETRPSTASSDSADCSTATIAELHELAIDISGHSARTTLGVGGEATPEGGLVSTRHS